MSAIRQRVVLRRLSNAFATQARRMDADKSSRPHLGLEHEYVVSYGANRIDFRTIIHRLGLGQSHLDPGDPNSYRMAAGAVLTADETEAEFALPAFPCVNGVTGRMAADARSARTQLQALLGPPYCLSGYSTHLSVEAPYRIVDEIARIYLGTFAPAIMLLLDRPTSPGLLVRPRPTRLELGGDFVDGLRLRAAAAMALGSVLACSAALLNRSQNFLPEMLRIAAIPDDRRFGWYVDRRAFGEDLYVRGREARLPLASGGNITAQSHLTAAWQAARPFAAALLGAADLSPVDRTVAGDLQLPCEKSSLDEEPAAEVDESADSSSSVLGDVIRVRNRPAADLAPVMVTWDVSIFLAVISNRSRQAFVCIPTPFLAEFLHRLDSGDLDDLLVAYLAVPGAGRRLERRDQALRPGLYDELGPRIKLLPKERPPMRRKVRWIRQLFQPAAYQ